MRCFLLVALAAFAAQAQEAITVLERREVPIEHRMAPDARQLRLTFALLDGSGWTPETVLDAAKESFRLLDQCGVVVESLELVRIGAPARFRDFHSPTSREFVRALP